MISNVDDLSYYQRPEGQTASYVYGNDHSPSEQYIWGAWETLYKGINNANMLIENVDGADMEDAIKTRIKGEAKFLRAYYHFLLVQGWYEVPLRPESFKDVNNSSKEATSHVEALDWIIQEMEDCVDMVDNTNYDLSPSYVKKNSVMGVLARVYLWRACYPFDGKISSDGKAYFEKAAYWATQVKNSNKHHLNPDVYTMWKAMASDTYDTEYNESIWEAEFIGTRDDGSYTAGRIGNVIGNIQKGTANPGNGYAYGKFRREWESAATKHKNYTPENYPLLRYADVLLMLAEAENEANQGPTTSAYEAINEVRERAGIDPLKNLSYSDFQQAVRDERARELCFESLRKYDLVRWGIYEKAIHDDLGAATKDSRWATGTNFIGAATYAQRTSEKHQFLPIPTKELGVNTKLKQNKYWE